MWACFSGKLQYALHNFAHMSPFSPLDYWINFVNKIFDNIKNFQLILFYCSLIKISTKYHPM